MGLKQKVGAFMILAAVAVAAPLQLTAQTNNWMSVRAIPKGTELIIERKNEDRVVGVMAAVSEDTIVVTTESGSFIIGRDNVSRIYHAVERRRKHAVGIAALVGGLAGAVLEASLRGEPESQEMPGVAGFVGGAVLAGLAAEKSVDDRKKGVLIYSAR